MEGKTLLIINTSHEITCDTLISTGAPMKKKTAHAIVLRFYNPATIDRLDNAAHSLNLSRSAYLRRCVNRGLEHTELHELPLLEHRAIRKALAR